MKFDDSKLRDAFSAIHNAQLNAADASAIIDVARFAASIDGQMGLKEMASVARVSKLVHAMSGGADAPVPSTPVTLEWMRAVAKKLTTNAPRELAYAVARLIILADDKISKEEAALAAHLTSALQITPARAQALDQLIAGAVTG